MLGCVSFCDVLVDSVTSFWFSENQTRKLITLSVSTYIALTLPRKLRSLLTESFGPMDGPNTLFSDSKPTIALVQNWHTKRIDIRYYSYHFIRYIKLVHCSLDDMTAASDISDTLTRILFKF